MDTHFSAWMTTVGTVLDSVGVLVMVIGALIATLWFIYQLTQVGMGASYMAYRQIFGRSILLGLEFLIGGDIIRTVAVAPTLMNVAVLGGIVVIRTFLSIALQLELEGRWPWQAATK